MPAGATTWRLAAATVPDAVIVATGPIPLTTAARDWEGDIDPWTPPVFVSAAAWRELTAAGLEPGSRWLPCGDDEEAAARAAGCAWSRRRSAAPVAVEALVVHPPGSGPRARLDALASRQLRITAIAERAPDSLVRGDRWCRGDPAGSSPSTPPAGIRAWPAVRLAQLDLVRAGLFAATSPNEDPQADAREALRTAATVEDALVLPAGEPPWRPLDRLGLLALAQAGGEGYRPVAMVEGGAGLAAAMPAIAAAGLPLVAVGRLDAAELERCVAVDGWWIAEAADRRGLHALLATALLDRSPWLLRLPLAWTHDLPPPDELHEPGAGRSVVAVERPLRWLVCTAAGLDEARALARLASTHQRPVAVLQAASLRPFPWQACAGDCAVLEEDGAAPLTACARAQGLTVTTLSAGGDRVAAFGRWLEI